MPTTSAKRFLGRKCQLQMGDAWTATVWKHIKTRDTLAVNQGKTLEDVTAEDSDGDQWEQAVLTTRSVEFTFFYSFNSGMDDEIYAALETAFNNEEPLPFAITDGPMATTGTKFRKLDLYVTEFNDTRDSKSAGKVSVKLTQGPTYNKPTVATVSGT